MNNKLKKLSIMLISVAILSCKVESPSKVNAILKIEDLEKQKDEIYRQLIRAKEVESNEKITTVKRSFESVQNEIEDLRNEFSVYENDINSLNILRGVRLVEIDNIFLKSDIDSTTKLFYDSLPGREYLDFEPLSSKTPYVFNNPFNQGILVNSTHLPKVVRDYGTRPDVEFGSQLLTSEINGTTSHSLALSELTNVTYSSNIATEVGVGFIAINGKQASQKTQTVELVFDVSMDMFSDEFKYQNGMKPAMVVKEFQTDRDGFAERTGSSYLNLAQKTFVGFKCSASVKLNRNFTDQTIQSAAVEITAGTNLWGLGAKAKAEYSAAQTLAQKVVESSDSSISTLNILYYFRDFKEGYNGPKVEELKRVCSDWGKNHKSSLITNVKNSLENQIALLVHSTSTCIEDKDCPNYISDRNRVWNPNIKRCMPNQNKVWQCVPHGVVGTACDNPPYAMERCDFGARSFEPYGSVASNYVKQGYLSANAFLGPLSCQKVVNGPDHKICWPR